MTSDDDDDGSWQCNKQNITDSCVRMAEMSDNFCVSIMLDWWRDQKIFSRFILSVSVISTFPHCFFRVHNLFVCKSNLHCIIQIYYIPGISVFFFCSRFAVREALDNDNELTHFSASPLRHHCIHEHIKSALLVHIWDTYSHLCGGHGCSSMYSIL